MPYRILKRLAAVTLALGCLLTATTAAAQKTLWAEAELAAGGGYVNQTLLYTLRVYSQGSLSEVDLAPPESASIVLQRIGNAEASYKMVGRVRYVVNEYRYLLTPLVPGRLEVPPASVTVTTGQGTSSAAGLELALEGAAKKR